MASHHSRSRAGSRAMVSSPPPETGFHALYADALPSAPASTRPSDDDEDDEQQGSQQPQRSRRQMSRHKRMADEIDAHDLMPDSEDEEDEEEAFHYRQQSQRMPQHTSSSPPQAKPTIVQNGQQHPSSPVPPASGANAVPAAAPKPAPASLDDMLLADTGSFAAAAAPIAPSSSLSSSPPVPDSASSGSDGSSVTNGSADVSSNAAVLEAVLDAAASPSPSAQPPQPEETDPAAPVQASEEEPPQQELEQEPTVSSDASCEFAASSAAAADASASPSSPSSAPVVVYPPDASSANLEFDASLASVVASLDAMQRLLQQQAEEAALHADEEQRRFEEQAATLRAKIEHTEAALAALAAQRADSAQKLDQLHSSLSYRRAEIAALQSSHAALSAEHAQLLSTRSARLRAAFHRAQPVQVLLRHSDGSRRGAHRGFLRAYRAEQKAHARARGHDNIHESDGDEEDDELEQEQQTALTPLDSPEDVAASATTVRVHEDGSVDLPEDEPVIAAAVAVPGSSSSSSSSVLVSDTAPAVVWPRRLGCFLSRGPLNSVRLALPRGVLDHTFTFLGVRDLQCVMAVCVDWNDLIRRRTRVWKLILQRVNGVQQRLRQEKERDRVARRSGGPLMPLPTRSHSIVGGQGASLLAPLVQQSNSSNNNNNHSKSSNNGVSSNGNGYPSSMPAVASVLQGSDSTGASPTASPIGTPLSRPSSLLAASASFSAGPSASPLMAQSGLPAAFASPSTPSTPGVNGGRPGLLGKMMGRFRSGSTATPMSSAVSSALASPSPGGDAAGSLSRPFSSAASFSSDFPPPSHLHYSLSIDLPSRDTYAVTVDARIARSHPADPSLCITDFPHESERKPQQGLCMHLCSLHARGSGVAPGVGRGASSSGAAGASGVGPSEAVASMQEELDFVTQVLALQANLVQARREKARSVAQMELDEGVKRSLTAEIAAVGQRIHAIEHDLDRLRQQNASDVLTRTFLEQHRARVQRELQETRERGKAAADERAVRAAQAEQARADAISTRLAHTAAYATLRAQKKTLTKEVKSLQAQLEQEREAKQRVRDEYEQLVATLNKLKGGAA